MGAPKLIEAALDERVVIFGSLPPGGRDIDIVAPAEQVAAIERALRAEGFRRVGGSLIRFSACDAEAVELVPVSSWGLPPAAARELFEAAIPLEGHTYLCRPAAADAMLIAARRLNRERPAEPAKAAWRFAAAREEHRGAIESARRRAGAWGVEGALGALELGEAKLALLPRGLGLYGERRQRGSGPLRSLAGVARQLAPARPRRGGLIALSGLDGSGKSTQAEALARTLSRLGFDARVEWISMANPRWLSRVLALPRLLLRGPASRRRRSTPSAAAELNERNQVLARWGPEPVRDAVLDDPRLTMAWSLVVALRVALRTGLVLRSEIWRGRVVVCDRYALDAWTYMRYHFPAAPTLRPQLALITLLSPRPLRAYVLLVDPRIATGRKPDFDAPENERRRTYYEEVIDRLGVTRLDGSRPPGEICARIAAEALEALASPRR